MYDRQFSWCGCDWKPIPSHKQYAASSCGKIARIDPQNTRKAVPYLKSSQVTNNYLMTSVSTGRGDAKPAYVHVLVCEAWNGPKPDGKFVCCHIDGNKQNNSAGNLIWADKHLRASLALANKVAITDVNPCVKLNHAKAEALRGEFAAGMSIAELAIKYGIRENAVRKIIKNKMWSNRSEAQQ